MKTKIYVIFLFLFALTFPGCNNELLEEEVFSFVSPGNFYQSRTDAVAAVNACYDALQGGEGGNKYYGRSFFYLVHVPTDIATHSAQQSGNLGRLENFTWLEDEGNVRDVWEQAYVGINRSNAVIERVPAIEMDEGLKTRLIGEALFLRALNYFNLVRLFGDLPLVTNETTTLQDIFVSRDPQDEVYQVIIEDLQFAENALPVSYPAAEAGRATQGAAKGLLAKVYLTLEEWALARDKAKEVIDGGNYGLFENYRDVFSRETKNGMEHLFSIQGTSGYNDEGTQGTVLTISPVMNLVPGGAWGTLTGEHPFWEEWDPDDARYDVTWINEFEVNGVLHRYPETPLLDNPHTGKYLYTGEEVAGTRDYPLNYNILRYSDVLLMYSEAVNEVEGPTAEAYAGINQVRARAEMPPLSGLTKEALADAILQERALELCFEYHRWFDLVRTNKLIEIMQEKRGITVEPHRTLFPIPQIEMDRNPNLTQNPGY